MDNKILQNLAFVDVETTGTNATRDRVIDIGIIRVENGLIIEEFESLINPQTHISPFILKMTAIDPNELIKAPLFDDVRPKLNELLRDATFVAHNVKFDYSFIKNEMARYGDNFRAKMLCTVKLSRNLYPEYKRHNLDSIIKRFNLKIESRHRALPDARAIYDFYNLAKTQADKKSLLKAVHKTTQRPSLPAHLDEDILNSIPHSPGVYLFYDSRGTVLYIGKSVDLYSRILSHFSSFHQNQKQMRLANQTADIKLVRTGGDLSASLLEAQMIKDLSPIHNRKLRRQRKIVAVIKNEDKKFHSLNIKRLETPLNGEISKILAVYPSVKKAKESLILLCKEKGICPLTLGLVNGSAPCFYSQIEVCPGTCINKVPALAHNIKLMEAFSSYYIPKWPFEGAIAIKESQDNIVSTIIIDQWLHLGTLGQSKPFEKQQGVYIDTVKILKSYFKKPKLAKKIRKATKKELELINI